MVLERTVFDLISSILHQFESYLTIVRLSQLEVYPGMDKLHHCASLTPLNGDSAYVFHFLITCKISIPRVTYYVLDSRFLSPIQMMHQNINKKLAVSEIRK